MGSTGRRPREPPAPHLTGGPHKILRWGRSRDRWQAQPLCPAQDKQATRTKPGGRAVPAPPWPAGRFEGGAPPGGGVTEEKRRPRQLTKANHPPHNHPAEAGGERRNAPRRDADGPRRTGQGPTRRPGTRENATTRTNEGDSDQRPPPRERLAADTRTHGRHSPIKAGS